MTSVEDRLREHLRRQAAEIAITDLLPAALDRGRRLRRRRWVAALGAVVVAAAVVLPIVTSGPAARRAAPAHRTGGPRVEVLAATNLGSWGTTASAMVSTPGSIWLASWDTGVLKRLDPRSARVTATVRIDRPQAGPIAMAASGGSLWVVDYGRGQVVRIALTTGRIMARIPVRGAIDIAFGAGRVWVGAWTPGPPWYRLVALDQRTGQVVADRALPGNFGPGLFVAAGPHVVWTLDNGGGRLRAFDPDTLRPEAAAPLDAGVDTTVLLAAGDTLWAQTDDVVSRLDRPWSRVDGSVELPGFGQSMGALAVGPRGYLIAAGPELSLVNRSTLAIHQVGRLGDVIQVAASGGAIWALGASGILFHLSLVRPGDGS